MTAYDPDKDDATTSGTWADDGGKAPPDEETYSLAHTGNCRVLRALLSGSKPS